MLKKRYYNYIFILCLIIFLLGIYYFFKLKYTKIVIVKESHILLKISKNWELDKHLIGSVNYKGKDGFVKIGEITGENLNPNTIDNLVKETINNYSLKKNYNIISSKINSQDARLIIPTNDNLNQCTLLIKYPKHIKINKKGILFDYLEIDADKRHIKDIAKSVKFIY